MNNVGSVNSEESVGVTADSQNVDFYICYDTEDVVAAENVFRIAREFALYMKATVSVATGGRALEVMSSVDIGAGVYVYSTKFSSLFSVKNNDVYFGEVNISDVIRAELRASTTATSFRYPLTSWMLEALIYSSIIDHAARQADFTAYAITMDLRERMPLYDVQHDLVRPLVHEMADYLLVKATGIYEKTTQNFKGDNTDENSAVLYAYKGTTGKWKYMTAMMH